MAKKKNLYTPTDPLQFPGMLLKIASWVYWGWMFIVFPLYFQNNYYNMGDAKFNYYRTYTVIYLVVAIVAGVFYLIIHMYEIQWKSLLRRANWVDRFVLLYLAGLLLSYFFTDYKASALWGYSGWFMGVLPQLSFILIYFFISRFFQWNRIFYWIMLVPASIAFLLALLHRFSIDPLGLYEGLNDYNKLLFLSTIGQATWYSSYMCILLPVGMFLFWHERTESYRKLLGAYCALGFATMVTQNSDSAFIAIALVFLTLFCCSFQSNEQFKRFLQLFLICIGSTRIVGVFQMLFPERVLELEALSFFVSKHPVFWAVLLLGVMLYVFFCLQMTKPNTDISHFKKVRSAVLILVILAVPLVLLLICVTTAGMLPESLRFLEDVEYLNFNRDWGNGRGFTWKYAASMFQEYGWRSRLFGCGPDCFAPYSYPLHASYIQTRWNAVLANAHNEWLNIILTLGLAGGLAYIGVFVSGIISFIKKRREVPLLLAIGCCLLSYMGHNLFCYQQVICTSLIFILLGLGSNLYNHATVEDLGNTITESK